MRRERITFTAMIGPRVAFFKEGVDVESPCRIIDLLLM
jgi:hypothetical protein